MAHSTTGNPKAFMDENFLLQTKSARTLYHEFAAQMPIIDFHCHLPPDEIASDRIFENLTRIWLYGDHYKWRAMRANGVAEGYCTGDQPDREKFRKWAETVPYTLRNPLYHWTHLELQRYFGVTDLLSGATADRIYDQCSERVASPEYSVRNLLRRMKVEVVCTTDDPLDSLAFHQLLKEENSDIRVYPSFRPDKFILIDHPGFAGYVTGLAGLTDLEIDSYDRLLEALGKRAVYFASLGCRVSDHGLEQIYAGKISPEEAGKAFRKAMAGQKLTGEEADVYKSTLLHELGVLYHKLGWVQQFHIGALRNNNVRALRELGPDTGWDSIGDFSQAIALSRFMGRLDEHNQLAKTILYNLNPADNAVMATMIGNFNDGSVAGKIQWGSGWWFLDQKNGMEEQMNTLSNMGLLFRFLVMLTDSRSFLSYPRHEYFRRILCNLLGNDIENGELPNDPEWIGKIVRDISYNNARSYFGF